MSEDNRPRLYGTDDDGESEDAELQQRIRDEALTLVAGIPRRREEQTQVERSLVHNARREGVTWDEIAAAIGVSAGWMARETYGEPQPEEGPGQ